MVVPLASVISPVPSANGLASRTASSRMMAPRETWKKALTKLQTLLEN